MQLLGRKSGRERVVDGVPNSDSTALLEPLEPRLLLSVDLPGMVLVDPAIDRFDGQVIFLDFDGARDVAYRGPVEVNGIDVPAFRAAAPLAGHEQEIVAQVLVNLEDTFAGSGVAFTLDQPAEGEFSTVYVGGNGTAFSEFGEFPGLAEAVDVGNDNPSDNAFVFSDNFIEAEIPALAERMAANIAHETGHLLGYAHEGDAPADGLHALAAESGYIVSVSPSTFTPGQAKTVTVRVRNTGDSDDMIIEWSSKPTGWSISPSYRNPYMYSGDYYDATFTVTPPSYASSGTIEWEFRDDDVLSNDLLDTWSQYVSASDTTAPSNPNSFSSSPYTNTWTTDNTVYVSWSGASDNVALKGYYYAWTTSSSTSVGTSHSYTSTSSGSGSKTSPSLSDNSNWYFHIRYLDTSDNLAGPTAHYGPFKIDRTSPSVPSLASPSNGAHTSDTTPYFDWSAASDSTSGIWKYQLIVETDTLGVDKINVETTNSYYQTSSNEALPAGGAGYDWRVRACDSAGNWGGWTSNWRLYVDDPPDTTPPSNPSTFSSNPSTNVWTPDNTVEISWSGASDNVALKGYYYAWTTSSSYSVGTNDAYTSTSSGSGSKTSSGLSDSANWYFHIRYADTSNNLASATAHFGPFKIDSGDPTVPSLITPVGDIIVSTAQPNFDWSDSSFGISGIQQYELLVESDILGVNKLHKTNLTSSQYTPTAGEALPEERLKWKVRAQDNAGNWSAWTGYAYFTVNTDTTPPGAPAFDSSGSDRLQGVWSDDDDPDIRWLAPSDPSGITGYSVVANYSSGTIPDQTVDTTGRQWTETNLADTDSLYVHVRAVDGAGNWGATAHFGPFKIDSGDPTVPSLITPVGDIIVSTAQPNFDWSDSSFGISGIQQYELLVESDILGVNKLHKTNLTSSQYTPTAGEALPEERLKWKVRAQDNAGNWSAWTGYAYFTVNTDPYIESVSVLAIDHNEDGFASELQFSATVNGAVSGCYGELQLFEDDINIWLISDDDFLVPFP